MRQGAPPTCTSRARNYIRIMYGGGGGICVLDLCARYFTQNRLILRELQQRAKGKNRTGYWNRRRHSTGAKHESSLQKHTSSRLHPPSVGTWRTEFQQAAFPAILRCSNENVHTPRYFRNSDSQLLNPEPASETFCFTCIIDDVIYKGRPQCGSWAVCDSRMSLQQLMQAVF